MIVRVPNFPPLDTTGKSPKPLMLLIGNGDWQTLAAAGLASSCGCVITTDTLVEEAVPTWHWMAAVKEYIDTADIIGIWARPTGLYLDEWTVAAYACGKVPQNVLTGAAPDPDHPMAPGFIHLAMHAGAVTYAKYDVFTAALLERARNYRSEHGLDTARAIPH
jgi:hypothetical protein